MNIGLMALTIGRRQQARLGEVIMYVVHVVFRIVPERLEDFLVAVKENAATSWLATMAVVNLMCRWQPMARMMCCCMSNMTRLSALRHT